MNFSRIFMYAVFLTLMLRSLTIAANSPSDKDISYWVIMALQEDPRVNSTDVKVDVNKEIVTLTGMVQNLAEKNYADMEAKKINGVKGVVNKLEIKPVHRSDTDIAGDIQRRLLQNAFVQSEDLKVEVENGKVTLRGHVNSWAEVEEAKLLTSEISGVQNVTSLLLVNYGELARPDAEIERDALATLGRDVYLTGLPLFVSVDDGVVTLTGKVGSVYQKERAASDVRWIENVKDVENNLKIIWWESDGVRQNPPALTDSELARAVKDELYMDLRIVDPFEIKVEAISGHITLEGTVSTYYEKKLAGKDSHDVVGVSWVSNLLKVKSESRPDDAILGDVNFELVISPALNDQIVDATVKDGVVTLTGDVDTFYEKIKAEEAAGNVKGVVDVVNEIHVKWSPRFTDKELAKHVKDRLKSNWETHWVADQIHVSVDKGFVILSGDVNLWSERQEAARLAYFTDGIRGVENRLTVKGIDYSWNELNHESSKVNF